MLGKGFGSTSQPLAVISPYINYESQFAQDNSNRSIWTRSELRTLDLRALIMAILLTGGTGKTSTHVAHYLQGSKIPFLLASRKNESATVLGMPTTKFDWLDHSTHQNPFEYKFPDGERISAIYLIPPEVQDPAPSMNAFVDLAVQKHGVRRFVLLSGSLLTKGGYFTGQVWQHLEDIGVDYTVLLATWFMGIVFAQTLSPNEKASLLMTTV